MPYCAALAADPEPTPTRRLPGASPQGGVLLPNQWTLRPAGKQIKVGDFPVNIALHPKQAFAAILHCGYGDHEIITVDLEKHTVVAHFELKQSFYGLCFDPSGEHVFASGGEFGVVHRFAFRDGYLSDHTELPVATPTDKYVVGGLACDAQGERLFAANPWGQTVCVMPLATPADRKQIAMPADSYPYTVLPAKEKDRLFVSLWGASGVAVVAAESGKVEAVWKTQPHPTEMTLSPDGRWLFVACANSNQVSVLDTEKGTATETLSTSLYPQAPKGSTPNSLTLTPDGKVLLVANADNNNLAAFDVSEPGHSRSLGFIPVGWYPTSVRYFAARKQILVTNGKGLASHANRQGPNPVRELPGSVTEYIGGLMRGTLSVIDNPTPQVMARYTQTATECSPLRAAEAPVGAPRKPSNPIPSKVGDDSPIKYCIYIIRENRTYDQVLGDIREGNGDADLCIFPEKVTPNAHALAREYVLLDNFYVDGEVSADGHEWTMGAYATDFVEKAWPLTYRGGDRGIIGYPSEGAYAIAAPNGGYLWDRAAEAKVSYRSYGEFVDNAPKAGDPGTARVKALQGHFDPLYRSFDLNYPDMKRAERFIGELARFEKEGDMPRLIVLRLPNDHTVGTVKGKPTPTAMVAENDLALGHVVEAVSKSKFWPETAIFVLEDDAQNGSDHVDAHRSPALVIGPHVKRHVVDSTMYSTSSVLRTMELILGLKPMSQFDAAARPMYASFQADANPEPFKHREAQVDLTAVNHPDAWGSQRSAKLDFSREDAADDLVLGDIVWRSVRGPESKMPPPVRASFVFTTRHGDDDDD